MEIKFDKRNYRIHNDRNKKLIKKSLEECGAGRSIVIDNDGEIIGGNGIYEAWGNKPVKVVETDGSELVVVKRTDLHTDDEKRKKLAVMDNTASDTSEMNVEMVIEDLGAEMAIDLGVDVQLDDCEIDMPDLKSGEKSPFGQMTFTLADGQTEVIKEALDVAKKDTNYDFVERMGNENSNGNALFMIVQEWLNGKR